MYNTKYISLSRELCKSTASRGLFKLNKLALIYFEHKKYKTIIVLTFAEKLHFVTYVPKKTTDKMII